ncbi:MAG: hypothetical protein II475_05950, partial [Bacteroidales bacterium]|nr:hypothetical protein [Bacteroidales bacterium]
MHFRIEKQFGKFATKYLDVRMVLVMDIILSVLVSALVLFGATSVAPEHLMPRMRFWLVWMISSLCSTVVMFLAVKTYVIIIRHTSFKDIIKFAIALGGKAVMMLVSLIAFARVDSIVIVMLCLDLLLSLLFIMGVRLIMIFVYDIYKSRVRDLQKCRRVLVYGTSDKSESAITRFRNSSHYDLIGIITP